MLSNSVMSSYWSMISFMLSVVSDSRRLVSLMSNSMGTGSGFSSFNHSWVLNYYLIYLLNRRRRKLLPDHWQSGNVTLGGVSRGSRAIMGSGMTSGSGNPLNLIFGISVCLRLTSANRGGSGRGDSVFVSGGDCVTLLVGG